MTNLTLQPLGRWPWPATENRRSPQFRCTWAETKALLLFEAEKLGAELVVVEIDIDGSAVRRDGALRASARVGGFPGARVSFESKHGPLVYATDRYQYQWPGAPMKDWQANVRAIALSLEALRAVDRHGITRSGEQYRGWRALPAGTGVVAGPGGTSVVHAADAPLSRERAARVLADLAGVTDPAGLASQLTDDGDLSRELLRAHWRGILRRLHPDRGGSPALFAEATAAYAALGGKP